MNSQQLASKYITSTESVLQHIQVLRRKTSLDAEAVEKVLTYVKDYLKDAKYYWDEGRFEVSLASVAYCEGLLDALKLLGTVKFEWSAKAKQTNEE
jgi:FAD synthetase